MESKVIQDIEEYKENVFIGMTLRQTLLGIAGVVILAAAYFTSYHYLDATTASYIGILLGLPCFMFAFYRPQNMDLEQYLALYISSELLSHRYRI